MFRKILIVFAIVLFFAIAGAYFFFSAQLNRDGREAMVCKTLNVVILDSLENAFITVPEIEDFMGTSMFGKRLDSINTYQIENYLAGKDVIATANAFVSMPDRLTVEVTQRKPVVRFQKEDFGFFADETGFILPLNLKHSINLPVVTGDLPIEVTESFRGYTDNTQWMDEVIDFTNYIRQNAYWSEEIEQISVESNGDLILYPKTGTFKIVFGGFDDREAKFEKLAAFYKAILPDETKNYTSINLKYKDQIVCK
ncbi:MAG: hypothetical protein J6Z27_02195 [Bacteroidales bacterium]|nr:hypothetical protein [Bacteroidales bacterium]